MDVKKEKIPKYKWVKLIIYIELIWKSLSTSGSWSLLAKKTTISFFSKINLDVGIIISSFLKMAPILISSGRFEFFNSLFISSEESIISASITSNSTFKIV